jgi:Ca-activated chloride channel family protein
MKPILVLLVAATSVALAGAQDTFKVNVESVQVYATVTDVNGRFVTDLERPDFRVFEDGKEQQIDAFSSDDSPLSVGILFDSDGEMGSNWNIAKQAALAFLKVGNLANEYFLIEYSAKPQVTEDYTADLDKLAAYSHKIKGSANDGGLDAIYAGLEKLRDARNPRKVLLVFTSGGFLKSQHSAAAVRTLARQLDVQIYGITLIKSDFHGTPGGRDSGETLIGSVGGQTFTPDNGRDFLNTGRKVAVGLRNQYILGYHSTNPKHDGKYRRLEVKLALENAPHLNVQTRNGYYSMEPER